MKKRFSLFAMCAVLLAALIFGQTTAMAETTIVDVKDYLSPDKWVDDSGNVTVTTDKIIFGTAKEGDSAAVKMADEFNDATYRFNIKLEKIPAGLNEEDGTLWDSALVIMVRAKLAGRTSEVGQAGYCISSWGDHSGFYVGKSGNDDYFTDEAIPWDLGDGREHYVEFTVENNDDGSVSLKFSVDGNVLFEGIDKGEVFKESKLEQQQKIHTDKGALMFRCKYLGATITGYNTDISAEDAPETTNTETTFEDNSSPGTETSSDDTSTEVAETESEPDAKSKKADSKSFLWMIIAVYSLLGIMGIVSGMIIVKKKKI